MATLATSYYHQGCIGIDEIFEAVFLATLGTPIIAALIMPFM